MYSKKYFKRAVALLVSLLLAFGVLTPTLSVFAASDVSDVSDSFLPNPKYIYQDHRVDAAARLDDLLDNMTESEIVTRAKGSGAIARLNLPSARTGSGEGLHGVAWEGQATMFPNSLGLSQTWDKELFNEIGGAIAAESLAQSITSAGRLAPVVDLLRDPRYGRAYETMGEDAYLVGSLGTAMAQGMNQRTEDGYQQFTPILKHFMGYNAEVNRLWIPSSLLPRSTQEYYVKAFKYPVSAGASKSLMNSYPEVNGKPMSVNPLQAELLNEWTPDYEGTGHYEYSTVNDYGSGSSMWVHSQRYFSDDLLGRILGAAEGIKNGQMAWSFRDYGGWGGATGLEYEALARGTADIDDYKEVARRTLALQLRFGDMDELGVQNPYLKDPESLYGPNRAYQMEKNKGLALRASQEQITLLKNDGVLPLSGENTSKAILLGPQGDQILKDFYSGSYKYRITLKDALENKLGADNLFFNRAIDSYAIKSVSTGKYLVGGDSPTYTASGSAGNALVEVKGTVKPSSVNDTEHLNEIFEVYDYGSANWLLRTPVNGRYVQVNGGGGSATPQILDTRMMYNNTTAPAEGNINETASGQNLTYSNYQKFRLIPTDDGYTAIYHLLSGDGINGGLPLAYDVDDEDINRGSYLYTNDAERVVPDIVNTNGPWQTEYNVVSPVDTVADDGKIDNLPNDSFKFDFETIQSVEDAARETILAANDPDAPVILVVGYEPHTNSREGVDLYKTGLSDQQMRLIEYVTGTLDRDVIIVCKTGNPMTFDKSVSDNPKVKAILLIGQTGQEEGAALVSALFDDGYSVPEEGFAPATTGQFTMNTGVGTNGPNQPYGEYPGYLPEGSRTIPAYAPAGRLSATWYDGIEQMIGASEKHPPSSFVYPAYDEETNDNLSNMNGTIPTGLLTYDIIKGERTYQYLNAKPHYAFGYGLTYTTFKYNPITVVPTSGDTICVKGSVTNTGDVMSDEIVEVYSKFIGTPSRIKQPNLKLIAYDRLMDIEPGETRAFEFEVDLTDKLGVYDVETLKTIVESGRYLIKAAPSSDANGASTTLTVSGAKTADRNLSKLTLAVNFDDYSNLTGKVQDIECVSSSVEYASNDALQYRANGAWTEYKSAVFGTAPQNLTVKVGSDRAGKLYVYALPAGSDPSALESAEPVATFNLENTRKGVSEVNLGKGPVGTAATPTTAGRSAYPGSQVGQQTAAAYVKPEYKVVNASVSGIDAGTKYDIYFLTENRGTVFEWLQFNQAPAETSAIKIDSIYSVDYIREARGEAELIARHTPVTASEPVVWSVENADGGEALATIDQDGVLKATGAGNGDVIVKAVCNGKEDTYKVGITNQLESNKVTINGAPKTVDFIYPRTSGWTFTMTDSISTYGGSITKSIACKELASENAANYTDVATYLTVPASELIFEVTDPDGSETDLATVTEAGVIRATGVADGTVLFKATLKNNPDIYTEQEIVLTNQGSPKNPYKMILFGDNNIDSTGVGRATSAYSKGGNEVGYYSQMSANSRAGFRNVNFSNGAESFFLRVASTTDATVSVWIDGYDEETGTMIGSFTIPATGANITYKTYEGKLDQSVSGVHDLYLVFESTAAVRANWFQFASENLAVDSDAMEILVADNSVNDDNSYAPAVTVKSRSAITARIIVAAYDESGKLIDKAIGEKTEIPANEVIKLSASIARNDNAASYRFYVWGDNCTPISFVG